MLILLVALSTSPGAALSLEEFAKFPDGQKGQFISASIGMAAYIAGAEGDVQRARCIHRWYFGTVDEVGEGAEAIATEVTIAQRLDPKRYSIYGILLGAVERACGAPSVSDSRRPDATTP